MNKEKKVEFTQKWIGDAVKKLLQKEDIYESDMERIKYLRIGERFDYCGYIIEMSIETPPEPFYATDGGDEWEPDGGAIVTGRFIQLFIDYMKENPFIINLTTGEHFLHLSQFNFWHKYKEEYKELETEEEGEDWEDTEKKWKSFEKTILFEVYREKFDNGDAFYKWYYQAGRTIQQDIGLFTGVEVLRLYGAEYQDMAFLMAMPLLRALEVAETKFVSYEGIDDLVRLKQLCCWLL